MAHAESMQRSEAAEMAAPRGAPIQKEPRQPAFSKKGILILGAVAVLEAAFFLMILTKSSKAGAPLGPNGGRETKDAVILEEELQEFLKVGRAIFDLGEIKVPISSTQPRAPRSLTAAIRVVVTQELGEKIAGGTGGGHGGGKGQNPQKEVLILNIRSILRSMMDSDGIRLLEPSAKADFERRAKDRLNNAQIDGDEEKAQVLKVLRGQVLQVIIDNFETQTY